MSKDIETLRASKAKNHKLEAKLVDIKAELKKIQAICSRAQAMCAEKAGDCIAYQASLTSAKKKIAILTMYNKASSTANKKLRKANKQLLSASYNCDNYTSERGDRDD